MEYNFKEGDVVRVTGHFYYGHLGIVRKVRRGWVNDGTNYYKVQLMSDLDGIARIFYETQMEKANAEVQSG